MALTLFFTTPVRRTPLAYAIVFVWPVVLLYMYWLIGGMELGRHVLFGSLVAFSLNSGIVSLPQRVLDYRLRHLQDMFVASPVGQLQYMLSHGVSRLLYAAPGCLFALGLLLVQDQLPLRSVPVVIIVVLLSWAIGCALGFCIAASVTSGAQLSAMVNLLGLFMVLIPPVMYPLELIDVNWRWLGLLAPSASAAYIIRTASGASADYSSALGMMSWVVVLLWLVAGLFASSRASAWQDN